ncbi:heavy-metal-associated domain-containing protein [Candidatus Gottesmanbacteria bacterium]|nr:heavy-metal-associated domain-containing protein [Candidatus Gottesmanbacteria bacterium]
MQTQTVTLSGLTCPACKKITEKRIGGLNGVTHVDVIVDTGIVTIQGDREISVSEIDEALRDTQYKVIV